MKFLFKLADGTISKAKVVAVLMALLGLAMALELPLPAFLTSLTPEQATGYVSTALGLLGFFIRHGVDKGPSA